MDIIGKKSIRIGKSLKGKSNIDSNVRIPRERERGRGRERERRSIVCFKVCSSLASKGRRPSGSSSDDLETTKTTITERTVVVAQLAERTPPTPDDPGLNPTIGRFYKERG